MQCEVRQLTEIASLRVAHPLPLLFYGKGWAIALCATAPAHLRFTSALSQLPATCHLERRLALLRAVVLSIVEGTHESLLTSVLRTFQPQMHVPSIRGFPRRDELKTPKPPGQARKLARFAIALIIHARLCAFIHLISIESKSGRQRTPQLTQAFQRRRPFLFRRDSSLRYEDFDLIVLLQIKSLNR